MEESLVVYIWKLAEQKNKKKTRAREGSKRNIIVKRERRKT